MTDIREQVKQKYAEAITLKTSGSCCGGSQGGCCSPLEEHLDPITSNLYSIKDLGDLDSDLVLNSFGCGNPTALAELNPGEVVLDLGSGAGLDVLLSAKRVGPLGKAYGLDMTDEMLAVARMNQEKARIKNAEFLRGHIEEIPLPNNSVDVIISNCVINLSGDKDTVLKEAFRVLKPGGRFAVSDIVLKRPLPESIKDDILAWAGCVAGALVDEEYLQKLKQMGFENIEIKVTREYDLSNPMMATLLEALSEKERHELNGSIVSAFIKAVVPR